MSERNYLLTSAIVFALFALLHLVRVITHWSIQIGAVTFPFWGSWLVFIIFAVLSVWAFRLMSEWKQSHP
jgi:lipopolysaccharide export LptBFGC system permease protein LptF